MRIGIEHRSHDPGARRRRAGGPFEMNGHSKLSIATPASVLLVTPSPLSLGL